jgi:mannitol/fructose-specific phosphotransferase system IIA component (Ntr-type)
MDCQSFLKIENVKFKLESTSLYEAVDELIALCQTNGDVTDAAPVKAAFLMREGVRTCCNETGVLLPRATCNSVSGVKLVIGRFENPIKCNCPDAHEVKLIFLMLGETKHWDWLKKLSHVAHMLSKTNNRFKLFATQSLQDLYDTAVKVLED